MEEKPSTTAEMKKKKKKRNLAFQEEEYVNYSRVRKILFICI